MLDINLGTTRDKFPLNPARRTHLSELYIDRGFAQECQYCALAPQLDISHEDTFSLTIRIFSTSPAAPMLVEISYDSIEQQLNPHCPNSRKSGK